MACRIDPEPWFVKELALISPRLRVVWSERKACFEIFEKTTKGKDVWYRDVQPNEQHRATLSGIRMENIWNEDSFEAELKRRRWLRELAQENKINSDAFEAKMRVRDILSPLVSERVGMNAPRIGEHPRAGLVEELKKETADGDNQSSGNSG